MTTMQEQNTMTDTTLDIHQILKLLPHRYPFLLVDRVLSMEKGKRITALKNVTMNEPFFNGHFPHRPVMPGVLMLEAMAQAAALLSFHSLDIVPTTTPSTTRRHRRRAFQAAGGARRPAHARGRDRTHEGRHLEVQGPRARGQRAGLRGHADVRHAPDHLIRPAVTCKA